MEPGRRLRIKRKDLTQSKDQEWLGFVASAMGYSSHQAGMLPSLPGGKRQLGLAGR